MERLEDECYRVDAYHEHRWGQYVSGVSDGKDVGTGRSNRGAGYLTGRCRGGWIAGV
jgi:hypothetical protein